MSSPKANGSSETTSGIKFGRIESILFASLFMMQKGHQYHLWNIYDIGVRFFIAMQWIGWVIRNTNFPIYGSLGQTILEVFYYMDYSKAWTTYPFLIILISILSTFMISAFSGAVIIGLYTLTGKRLPRFILTFFFVFYQITASSFFIPYLDIFFGPYRCILGNEAFYCNSTLIKVLMVIGPLFAVIMFLITLSFNMFMHSFDIRYGGIFSCQSSFFFLINYIATTIFIPLLLFIHESSPNGYINIPQATIKIIKIFVLALALLTTFLMQVHAIWYYPFYRWQGNAIHGMALGIYCYAILFGIVLEFIGIKNERPMSEGRPDNVSKAYIIVVWFLFGLGVIIVCIVSLFLTYWRAKFKWAVKYGQNQLPLLPGKDKSITNSKMRLRNAFSLQSGNYFSFQSQNANAGSLESARPIQIDTHRSNFAQKQFGGRTQPTKRKERPQLSSIFSFYDRKNNPQPHSLTAIKSYTQSQTLVLSDINQTALLNFASPSPPHLDYTTNLSVYSNNCISDNNSAYILQPEEQLHLKRFTTVNDVLMSIRYLTDDFIFKGEIPPKLKNELTINNTSMQIFEPVATVDILNFTENLLLHAIKKFHTSTEIYILTVIFFRMYRNYAIIENQYDTAQHYSLYALPSMTPIKRHGTANKHNTIWREQGSSITKMNEYMRTVMQIQPHMHDRWVIFCVLHQMQNKNNNDKAEVFQKEKSEHETNIFIHQIVSKAQTGNIYSIMQQRMFNATYYSSLTVIPRYVPAVSHTPPLYLVTRNESYRQPYYSQTQKLMRKYSSKPYIYDGMNISGSVTNIYNQMYIQYNKSPSIENYLLYQINLTHKYKYDYYYLKSSFLPYNTGNNINNSSTSKFATLNFNSKGKIGDKYRNNEQNYNPLVSYYSYYYYYYYYYSYQYYYLLLYQPLYQQQFNSITLTIGSEMSHSETQAFAFGVGNMIELSEDSLFNANNNSMGLLIANNFDEQSNEAINETFLLTYMHLKYELDVAQNITEIAKYFFIRVCLLLSKEYVDLERVMKLLVKTVEYGRKARKMLMELVEYNPSNPLVIRALGNLVRDVEHSNDEAELLFVYANTIEDEAARGDYIYQDFNDQLNNPNENSKDNTNNPIQSYTPHPQQAENSLHLHQSESTNSKSLLSYHSYGSYLSNYHQQHVRQIYEQYIYKRYYHRVAQYRRRMLESAKYRSRITRKKWKKFNEIRFYYAHKNITLKDKSNLKSFKSKLLKEKNDDDSDDFSSEKLAEQKLLPHYTKILVFFQVWYFAMAIIVFIVSRTVTKYGMEEGYNVQHTFNQGKGIMDLIWAVVCIHASAERERELMALGLIKNYNLKLIGSEMYYNENENEYEYSNDIDYDKDIDIKNYEGYKNDEILWIPPRDQLRSFILYRVSHIQQDLHDMYSSLIYQDELHFWERIGSGHYGYEQIGGISNLMLLVNVYDGDDEDYHMNVVLEWQIPSSLMEDIKKYTSIVQDYTSVINPNDKDITLYTNYMYILTNYPRMTFESMKQISCKYVNNAISYKNKIYILNIVMGLISTILFIIFLSFEYWLGIRKVTAERTESFLVYLLTPKRVIKKILLQLSEEQLDEEEEKTRNNTTNENNYYGNIEDGNSLSNKNQMTLKKNKERRYTVDSERSDEDQIQDYYTASSHYKKQPQSSLDSRTRQALKNGMAKLNSTLKFKYVIQVKPILYTNYIGSDAPIYDYDSFKDDENIIGDTLNGNKVHLYNFFNSTTATNVGTTLHMQTDMSSDQSRTRSFTQTQTDDSFNYDFNSRILSYKQYMQMVHIQYYQQLYYNKEYNGLNDGQFVDVLSADNATANAKQMYKKGFQNPRRYSSFMIKKNFFNNEKKSDEYMYKFGMDIKNELKLIKYYKSFLADDLYAERKNSYRSSNKLSDSNYSTPGLMIDRNYYTKSSEFLFNKQSSEPKTEYNKDVGTDSKLQKKYTDIYKRIASMKYKSQSFMVSAKPKLQQYLQYMHQYYFSYKGQLQLKDQLTQKILLRRLNMQIQPFRNLTEKKIQRSPFIISARNPSNNPFKQQHSYQRTYDENTANDLYGNTMKGSKASTSKYNRRKRKQRRRDGSSPRKPKIQTFERFNPGLSNRQINALNYMPHVSQNTMPDLNYDEFSYEYTIMSLYQPQYYIMSIPLEQDIPNIIKNRSLIIDSMKKLEGYGDKQMQYYVENEGPAKVPKSLFHFVIGSKTQITADYSQQSTFSVIGTDLSSGVITSYSSEISLSYLKEIKNKIKIDKENEKNRDRSNSGSKMGYIDSIQDQSTMDENMDFLSIQEQFSQKGSAILGKNGSLPSINIVQNKSSSLKQLQSYQDSPSQSITKRAISQPNSYSMLDPLSRPFTVSPQYSNMFNHSSSQPSLISHKTVTSHNSQKSHISFYSHTSYLTFQSPMSRNSLSPVLVQSPEVMDPQLIRKLSHSLSETMSKEEEELIQKTIENELQKEPKNVLAGTEYEYEKSMTVMTDARYIQVEDLTQDLRQSYAFQTPIHLTPTYQTPSHLTPTFSTPTNLTPMYLGNYNSIYSFTQFSLQDSNLLNDNDGYNNNNEYNIKQPYQFTPLNPNMVKKQQLSYINEISYPTYVSDYSIDQDKVKSDNTQSNSFGGVEILEDTLNKFEAKTNYVRLENQQEVRLEKQQEYYPSSETEKQKSVFSSQFLAVLHPTVQTPQKYYRNLSSPDSEHLQFKIPSEITTYISSSYYVKSRTASMSSELNFDNFTMKLYKRYSNLLYYIYEEENKKPKIDINRGFIIAELTEYNAERTEYEDKDKPNLSPEQLRMNLLDHKRNELRQRIGNMQTSVVPMKYYIRPIIGVVFMIVSVDIYVVMSCLAGSWSVRMNASIIVDDMRMITIQNMALMAIFISQPLPSSLHFTNVVDDTTTNPLFADLSHLSRDPAVIKDILAKSVLFVYILTKMIDSIESGRVLTKKSGLTELMYNSTACLYEEEGFHFNNCGDCDNPNRIYGLEGRYAGLSALIEEYLIMGIRLAKSYLTTRSLATQPSDIIDLDHITIRYMNYAIRHDLSAGLNIFQYICIDNNIKNIKTDENMVTWLFAYSLISIIIAVTIFLLPFRGSLFSIHLDTQKMNEILPDSATSTLYDGESNVIDEDEDEEADDEEIYGQEQQYSGITLKKKMMKKKMREIKIVNDWNYEFASGVKRIDIQHQLLLKATKELVKTVIELFNAYKYDQMKQEEQKDEAEQQNDENDYRSNTQNYEEELAKYLKNTAFSPIPWLYQIKPTVNSQQFALEQKMKNSYIALKSFTVVLFSTLADEELLMIKAKIVKMHRYDHGFKHSIILREMIGLILKAAKNMGWQEDPEEYEEFSSYYEYQQYLMQFLRYNESEVSLNIRVLKASSVYKQVHKIANKINNWALEHLSSSDRDIGLVLSSRLNLEDQSGEKAPALLASEFIINTLKKSNTARIRLVMPLSLQQYFHDENLHYKERQALLEMKQMLNFK